MRSNKINIILLLSFLLKIVWIKYIEYWPTMDAESYLRTAKSIIEGNFPDIYWPVGYGFFLSIFYPFKSIFLFKVLNSILSTFASYFIIKISEIIYKNSSVIISVAIAFFPESIFYCSTLWSETFFLFLLSASIYFQLKENYYKSGILYSLQFFVRPVSIFLPFLIRFYIQKKKEINTTLFLTRILLPIFLFHFTWSVILYNKMEKLVFVSTNGPTNLFIGNNPKATGHYDEDGLLFASQQNINSKNYIKYVIDYWIVNYYELPILFSKKIYFLIFGETREFKASSAMAIHHLSKIPKILTKEQYNKIFDKISEKYLLEKGYKLTNNYFYLNPVLTDLEKSQLAHSVLYTFEANYDTEDNHILLANISTMMILYTILSSFIFVLYKGLRQDKFILIPIYFILFYTIFFGSPRYLYPVYPFFILYSLNSTKIIKRHIK